MNYQKIYEQLTAKDMIADYTETHHIIPRCMGGTNDWTNLVRLTPEAHYVAHQLLVKIYPDNHKLVYAANMMTVILHGRRTNNKLYGWLRRKMSSAMSTAFKGKPVSAETRAKMSKARKGKPLSTNHKDNIRSSKQFISDETRTKIRISKQHISDNTKAKMSASLKAKPKVSCPHCNKKFNAGNFTRWHGNNCKHK